MNKHLIIAFICAIILVSCKKDKSISNKSEYQLEESIVLFERPSSKPFVLSNKTLKSPAKAVLNDLPGPLDIRYYLGRAYNTRLGDVGSPDGVRFPVIDIERLVLDNPDLYFTNKLGYSDANRYSFSSFDRYEEKSNSKKTISGGFSLNLGIFSIGAKHKFESTFSSETVNNNNQVFGELDVVAYEASHEILYSSIVLQKIKENYINKTFTDQLYNAPTGEFVNNYGGFVIINFISGGRANALFTGKYLTTSNTQIKEGSMDNSISASYGFKDKSGKENPEKSTFEFGIGNGNGSTIAKSNNIGEFKASIKTYGGGYGYGSFTVPKSIDDINIDFSSWGASLNDKSTHVLVGFKQGGLLPIGEIIGEENMSFNINKLIENEVVTKPFREPAIEARWIRLSGANTFGLVTVVLRTRFGDELVITNNKKQLPFSSMDAMLNFAKQEALKKLPFYKVKVTAINTGSGEPYFNASINYINSIVNIDESTMQKFYNEKSKTTYLLSQANGRKFAYAIHDDYIFDTYGIREWVNNMTSSSIKKQNELQGYTIVAL